MMSFAASAILPATLLPLLLFHDNLTGIRRFVELVDNKAKTERDSAGQATTSARQIITPDYNGFKDVEVITEFHIAHDLKAAHLPLCGEVP